MRFWSVCYDSQIAGSGIGRTWFPEEIEARAYAIRLRRESEAGEAHGNQEFIVYETEAHNVPTRKAALLDWLNIHAAQGF